MRGGMREILSPGKPIETTEGTEDTEAGKRRSGWPGLRDIRLPEQAR